ncbi:MAG: peptide chain release factor subunit 1 [archaeon GW2011_AR3]|nr:MAG: peptide chain release factor subunit 1 [archaeon GW2011_AR3]MBS3110119.1 peptide chain release factor aRF-1 [Candidatus Woesearchaeota archaeon]
MINSKQRFELKKIIKELETYRGRHTELVSVYVPEGYDLNKILNHLAQEQGTASNIKSTATRKNVIDALEKMIQHLRLYSSTPIHGLAVFSGNVAEKEGQSDVKVWSLEPPIPVKIRLYRCDKEFQLDLLRDMMDIKESYGLVVLDRREAQIAVLRGKTIVPLIKLKSNVPGKTRAGGQSAQRFESLRDLAALEFYKKIAQHVKEEFLMKEGLKGILLGGPGPTKYDWMELAQLTNELKKKVIAIKDLSYTDEFGLQELVDKSQDVLANEEIAEEKQAMTRFFETLLKQPNKCAYGEKHVMSALQMGAVDTLLLSETLEDDKITEFEEIADKYKTDVKIISVETREGVQLRDMGKFAAVLRFEYGG